MVPFYLNFLYKDRSNFYHAFFIFVSSKKQTRIEISFNCFCCVFEIEGLYFSEPTLKDWGQAFN